MSPRLIEVSHPIRPGMKTYPGLPEPRAEVLLDYDASREKYGDQAEFMIASLHLCSNTGTYVLVGFAAVVTGLILVVGARRRQGHRGRSTSPPIS